MANAVETGLNEDQAAELDRIAVRFLKSVAG